MPQEVTISHGRIVELAWGLYRRAPLPTRLLQRWRDSICPFGMLVDAVPPASTVLDLGCGGGLFLLLLAATGRARGGAGVDTSGRAIAVARQALGELPAVSGASGHGFEFIHAASWNDWPAGSFDVVSMVDVMHHVAPSTQRDFFCHAARRLTPSGVILYKDMCCRPFLPAAANRLHDLLLARQWIHYVPLDEVVCWASQAGLVVERRLEYRRFLYGHEMVVFRRGKTVPA